jgi:transcriptional regulator with XRE-family HTH domain
MEKKKPRGRKTPAIPATKEAMAIQAGAATAGLSQAAIAEMFGLQSAAVQQWFNGSRPVPIKYVPKLAHLIDVPAEKISPRYVEVASEVAELAPDARRAELAESRIANDIEALRYALAGIVAITVKHRPAEASAVAAQLRRTVPRKFLQRGFVHGLLETLDKADDE